MKQQQQKMDLQKALLEKRILLDTIFSPHKISTYVSVALRDAVFFIDCLDNLEVLYRIDGYSSAAGMIFTGLNLRFSKFRFKEVILWLTW
jgi:hypothetical protein